jgi:hypothetical protein
LEHREIRSTARRYRTVKIKAGRQILTAADPQPDELREAITKISGQLEHPLSLKPHQGAAEPPTQPHPRSIFISHGGAQLP